MKRLRRRFFVGERGVGRRRAAFAGHRHQSLTEEQLRGQGRANRPAAHRPQRTSGP
ncbi:hypothetical protein ACFW5S_14975 [Streptomyces olivaceus]|uniref:hypothetical protein n=1 Tax=Streptomyces olivaceus TaxID=47716 RepID=UPI00369D0C15